MANDEKISKNTSEPITDTSSSSSAPKSTEVDETHVGDAATPVAGDDKPVKETFLEKNDKIEEVSSKGVTFTTGTISVDPISPSMSPKEAYFKMLRIWVNQANFTQNAMACFPYYLLTNYPHLMTPPSLLINNGVGGGVGGGASAPLLPPQQPPIGGQLPNIFGWNYNPAGNLGGAVPLLQQQQQPQPPIPPPVNQPILQRLAQNMFNRNRIRQEDNMIDNVLRNEQIIRQNGGYEFVIAPLWKRFVAETIDVIILFILKLIVAFMIIDIFEIDLGFDFDAIRATIEQDYTEFIAFSSEMIYIEIITKFFVCIYEAFWTREGYNHLGATPGKVIMGLRILHAEAVIPLPPLPPAQQQQLPLQPNVVNQIQQPLRALIFPAKNLGFHRAFLRALTKNVFMALMFPLCFIMLFFRNNRTSYDLMTKTIVVEENSNPILRRL